MINVDNLISPDNYKVVAYYIKSHVDKNEFLDAVLREDDFDDEPQTNDVKYEYWRIMNDKEMKDEGVDGDGDKEYYYLSEESDPRSIPITVIYLDDDYKVR